MKSLDKNLYLKIMKNNSLILKKALYIICWIVICTNSINAQENQASYSDTIKKASIPLYTNNAFMFGIGSANMYDTYLSPLKYTGMSFRLFSEKMRRTTWFDYNFYKQQIIEIEFAEGDNLAKNASEYWLMLDYRLGGHYQLYKKDAFNLKLGGIWDINAGVLYNQRNGNNPASARLYSNINLSVLMSYKFSKLAVRWQLDTPLAGILFSPRYGESYYEISLGNSVGLVNFASLNNQRSLRNYLTVDIPLNTYTIRIGYLGTYYQTKVHELQTHHYTHNIVIGFPIEGIKTKRKIATNTYWE